ncbi:uncharacterized protein LOC131214296 [Anopheles bellator]|uniref:uncharacterized protein LOC131214296 n=1 Tax=Anopheles bellator TaxID=139047 RepID=UPI002648FD62|nr:uncharacterized protein LOC131214296 [Anopheles bellator]
MDRAFLLLFFVAMRVAGDGTHTIWEHRCDPGSEVFACSVASFIYNPGEKHSRLIVPDRVRKIRLLYPWEKIVNERDKILAYDKVLHAELNHPRAIYINYGDIRTIEIPVDLEYAEFQKNKIEKVIAPEARLVSAKYSLRYLDLTRNHLADIANLSALVNLETLILQDNRLKSVDTQMFEPFANLTTLVLTGCWLRNLDLQQLPPSLVYLGISSNRLSEVYFDKMHLPDLEVLSMKRNDLFRLNIHALREAAPNLKLLQIARNHFGSNVTAALLTALQNSPILFDDFDERSQGSFQWNGVRDHQDRQRQIVHHVLCIWSLTVVNLTLFAWVGYRFWKTRKSNAPEPTEQA